MGVGNLTGYDRVYQSVKASGREAVEYRRGCRFQWGLAVEPGNRQITQAIYYQQYTFVM
jgi:hypothetical protein